LAAAAVLPAPLVPALIVAPAQAQAQAQAQQSEAIGINIDGRTVEADPAPVLRNGSVFVPLRGVLETMGAKVEFVAADNRVDIAQGEKRVSLRVGQNYATVDARIVDLPSPAVLIGQRAFVPLRFLAELFGYEVDWLNATRTVSISSEKDRPRSYTDHRVALEAGGRFGVTIDFHDVTPEQTVQLLDAAKKAGAGLIKTRFDWNTLEPKQGSAFQWSIYDRVVREARLRNLIVIGVLGNSTRWASSLTRAQTDYEWRNAPPREANYAQWQNYVRRTVGRYGNDVHAWQVWEYPASFNFRSVAKNYRTVVRLAAQAARQSDTKALIFGADSGGVNIGFIDEFNRNGLMPLLSGVTIYPTSQWQPGLTVEPESFLLPFATLLKQVRPTAAKNADYWIGGLTWPVLDGAPGDNNGISTTDPAVRERLQARFTPLSQADYLTRASVLALAAGSGKTFWGALRDPSSYEPVEPVNTEVGGGLLRRDFTPRPSFNALATMSKLISDKPFAGSLALGPNLMALLFDDAKTGHMVVWGLRGTTQLVFNTTGVDPQVPNSLYITTRADSEILDSTGERLAGEAGTLQLTSRPVWITNISYETAQAARKNPPADILKINLPERPAVPETGATATFGTDGVETGMYWKKYLAFRGSATKMVQVEGRSGLVAEYSPDPLQPILAKPVIYLDVDDDYMYFARKVPVTVTVEVLRPPVYTGNPALKPAAGFNLQYDSPTGHRFTEWNNVEEGTGWARFEIKIPDAMFANRNGYDLVINALGSRVPMVFSSVTVKRADGLNSGPQIAQDNPAQTGTTAVTRPQ